MLSWKVKYATTKTECNKLFEETKYFGYEFCCLGVTHTDYQNRTMIVGVFDNTRATLAHEMNHVVIRVMDEMQVTINNSSSEFFCRTHDYLCKTVEDLKKKKKKTVKK